MCVVMDVNETKKCRIVPKKNRFVPDLLLQNKRIEKEVVMEINKAEISRAMSLADVYMIGEDKSETLLTPKNFYLKVESESTEKGDKEESTPSPDEESETNDGNN